MKNNLTTIIILLTTLILSVHSKSQTIFGIDISSTNDTSGWILEKEFKKKSNEYAKYDISIWDKIIMIEDEGFIFLCLDKDIPNFNTAYWELEYVFGTETRNESWYEKRYYEGDSDDDREYYISRNKAYWKDIWNKDRHHISLIYDSNSIRILIKLK